MSTPEAAELTKLLENIFRSVNIALVNELAILCDRMGIDVWEVVEAAATKPYGFMSFKPGPGMGGHCLPVDPFYLAWRAREFDMQTEFVELAGEVNQRMPYFCVERIARALNDHAKPVSGSRDRDLRRLVQARRGRPARVARRCGSSACCATRAPSVAYHDDYVPELPDFGLRSEWPEDADCAVIVTAHPGLDLERVVRESPLVVDFRGVTRGIEAPEPGPPVSGLDCGLRSERAPGLLLGEGVELPADVELGGHVVVHAGSVVGEGARLQDGCVVGKPLALGVHSTLRARGAAGPPWWGPARGGRGRCGGGRRARWASAAWWPTRRTCANGPRSGTRRWSAGVAGGERRAIGARVRMQTGAYVTAWSVVEDDVFIAPGRDAHERSRPPGRRPAGWSCAAPTLRRGCRIGARRGAAAGRGGGRGGVRGRGRRGDARRARRARW